MKSLVAGTLIVAGLAVAAPAVAQGIYVGPGGVGVDTGLGYGRGHRDDYYRDRDYRDGYRHRGYYEGRSSSRGFGSRNYFDHY